MNAFKLALEALTECKIHSKINQVNRLHTLANNAQLNFSNPTPIKTITTPGKPAKPNLVRFQSVPKRNHSELGMIQTIHAICHIEFNAINLALDAVYRFQEMPEKFYLDWILVAFEEGKHFNLVNNYLQTLGYQYGDFDAHNGLWKMTLETNYDVLARMALVPRVLEARGLDVTPSIQKRFRASKFSKMVEILDIIFVDEIGHVKIGNYWYHLLCAQRNLDSIKTFQTLINKHIGGQLRGPFNIDARKLADFSQQELDFLTNL
jgi:uncharacterized ferritin-like protein (DUF455 family)